MKVLKIVIYVNEKPKNCPSCQFSHTYTSEPDPYGGICFQSEEWRTHTDCSLLKESCFSAYYNCPLVEVKNYENL